MRCWVIDDRGFAGVLDYLHSDWLWKSEWSRWVRKWNWDLSGVAYRVRAWRINQQVEVSFYNFYRFIELSTIILPQCQDTQTLVIREVTKWDRSIRGPSTSKTQKSKIWFHQLPTRPISSTWTNLKRWHLSKIKGWIEQSKIKTTRSIVQ